MRADGPLPSIPASSSGSSSNTVIQVYNIGTAPGRPVFSLTSGLAGVFMITRTGVTGDPEIPAGGSATYSVIVTSTGEGVSSKAARYSLDDGGFDFSVAFVAAPFKTQFVNQAGTPITLLDLGVRSYGEPGATETAAVYLKRISASGTAQAEGIRVQANSFDGSTNGVSIAPQGTLAVSSVVQIPVYITLMTQNTSDVSVLLIADHGVAPLEVRIKWVYESDQQP